MALRRHTRSLQGRRRAGAQLPTCRHRRRREVVARRRIRGQAARPAWSGEGEARGGTRPSTSRRRSPRRRPTPPCPSPSPPLAGLLVSSSCSFQYIYTRTAQISAGRVLKLCAPKRSSLSIHADAAFALNKRFINQLFLRPQVFAAWLLGHWLHGAQAWLWPRCGSGMERSTPATGYLQRASLVSNTFHPIKQRFCTN